LIKNTLDKDGAFRLAYNLAAVLSNLEKAGIGHCDLTAGNVMVDADPKKLQIELVDVDDIFAPGVEQPKYVPSGTTGYQHPTSTQREWHAQGNRFAGGILLGGMLGGYDDTVRAVYYGEIYFDPNKLQSNGCRRLEVLSKAVFRHDNGLVDMLRRAWESTTLEESPQ
jgi:hypothetical protein